MFDKVYDLSELVHMNDPDTEPVPVSDFMQVTDTELMKIIGPEPDRAYRLDDLTLSDDWFQRSADKPAAATFATAEPDEPTTTKRFGRYGEIYGGYLD